MLCSFFHVVPFNVWRDTDRARADVIEDERLAQTRVLLLTCAKDPLAIAGAQAELTRRVFPLLEVRELTTGHWPQLEDPEKVNAALEDFIMKA